jgi:hypothetical protein
MPDELRSPARWPRLCSLARSTAGTVYFFPMPSIKDVPGPYRLFFYSFDCNEPVHIHVQRERMLCKFWLEPVELARNEGFTQRELNRIRQLIESNLARIRKAWDEHCNPD